MDDSDAQAIAYALQYLVNGGLGEVWGLAIVANDQGSAKVQMDTDLALALIQLAQEGLSVRKQLN